MKRTEREKRFLLRSSDELTRTLASVNDTIGLLIRQVEASAAREPGKGEERLALLNWYQNYTDWLKGISSELDQETSNYYAKQKLSHRWISLYEELAAGCQDLTGELRRKVQKLENEKNKIEAFMQKIETAITERRVLVSRDDLEVARELWPTYRDPYDRREAVYLDLTDEEVLLLRKKLSSLDEQRMYFECLTELGKYEQDWQDIKAKNFAKLNEIAKIISHDVPGAHDSAFMGAIRTYETDIAVLKRRSDELDAKIHGITRTGTLNRLDRMEELSRYYEKMKSRYDSHVEWAKGQIGSYQADLVELAKEFER